MSQWTVQLSQNNQSKENTKIPQLTHQSSLAWNQSEQIQVKVLELIMETSEFHGNLLQILVIVLFLP